MILNCNLSRLIFSLLRLLYNVGCSLKRFVQLNLRLSPDRKTTMTIRQSKTRMSEKKQKYSKPYQQDFRIRFHSHSIFLSFSSACWPLTLVGGRYKRQTTCSRTFICQSLLIILPPLTRGNPRLYSFTTWPLVSLKMFQHFDNLESRICLIGFKDYTYILLTIFIFRSFSSKLLTCPSSSNI